MSQVFGPGGIAVGGTHFGGTTTSASQLYHDKNVASGVTSPREYVDPNVQNVGALLASGNINPPPAAQ